MEGNARGESSVIAVVLMVAVVVILGSVVGGYVFGVGDEQTPAPAVSVSYETVEAGSERTIAVTLEAGDAVETDKLYVIASKDIDIGGAPGSSPANARANENFASGLEKFTESSGTNPPQVGIGDTWEAGETVYLDPVGSVDGVTVSIYWNTDPVDGVNPGTVRGEDSYKIAEFTVNVN
jgi:flagellin-like protein